MLAPQKRKKKIRPLEHETENDFVDHVYACGCWAFKLNPFGRRGLPDRLCIGPYRFILFVELKRLGEEPTPIQKWLHDKLRKFDFTVVIPDNIDDAVAQFNEHLAAHMRNHKNDDGDTGNQKNN